MELTQALQQLDPTDDQHWTDDGAPRLDVLKELVGAEVSREQVRDHSPLFTRDVPTIGKPKEPPKPAPAPPAPPVDSKRDEPAAVKEPAKAPEVPNPGGIHQNEPPKNSAAMDLLRRRNELRAAEESHGLERLNEINAEIFELQQEKQAIEARITKLDAERAHYQRFEKTPQVSAADDQKARMDYIQADNRRKQERFDQQKQLAASLPALQPVRAPIDNAMRRRTDRGEGRPLYPPKEPETKDEKTT